MVRKRNVGVRLFVAALCLVQACGRSKRVDNDGEANESASGAGLGGGMGAVGGVAGNATGGFGGVSCDAPHCLNGFITWGPCPGAGYLACDRAVSGVDCVSTGECPTVGRGGTAGVGGGGRGGGSGTFSGTAGCDGLRCVDGHIMYSCPGEAFIPCPLASGVACVTTGSCPRIGEGGAGGEAGAT